MFHTSTTQTETRRLHREQTMRRVYTCSGPVSSDTLYQCFIGKRASDGFREDYSGKIR